ncbi:unnamed protein product [Paramecium pentaurelia]|uniref:Myb-like domain-containing protein n=1 Tax=Paramecium pentaurelia TaxID=43138 RepID=A0A8S1T5C8_9CILI|nr:unnamed protein product [Paramecium pentaurelia]
MKSDVTVPAMPICKAQELYQNNNLRSGHWTPAEHQLYLDFLHQSQDLIESSQNNKGQRLFKKMSQVIATRSPSQCRSHHQKFNPFNVQMIKRKKNSKLSKPNKEMQNQIRSKQYFRKLFASLKDHSSESISEEELQNNIQ